MSERLDFTRGYGQCLALNHNATLGAHQESPECRHWEPRVSKEQLSALTAQLRARDEALRLAREALKKAKGQLETLWDLSPGHEGADCPEDDTCECGNVAEFTEAHEATKAALAAIKEAAK